MARIVRTPLSDAIDTPESCLRKSREFGAGPQAAEAGGNITKRELVGSSLHCLVTCQRSANVLKGRNQLVAATALHAGLDVSFVPYLFENCVDETWQLERFPTRSETSRMKRQRRHDYLYWEFDRFNFSGSK